MKSSKRGLSFFTVSWMDWFWSSVMAVSNVSTMSFILQKTNERGGYFREIAGN
jgi:hypothetical protein